MLASVVPSSVMSPDLTPSMLTTGTMPPMTIGHWISAGLGQLFVVNGLSDAPNVTVLAVICLMPPPEPID